MITAATLSNNTLTVVFDNGTEIHSETSSHPKWAELVDAYRRGDENALRDLFSMAKIVEKFSGGGLTVSDNAVFYQNIQLHGIDVDRVLAFLRQNLPYRPIANYMVRKFSNTSKRAIDEMYNFLEHKNMPLTPEGKIIAYKGVLKDFFSVSSGAEPLLQGRRNENGQIFNGIGEVIEMNRSFVNDDYLQGCSNGLHAGSLQYARDWATQHDGIIILIEIDPADVVSVPSDCNCSKLRCCKYKILNKYDGPLPDTFTADYSSTSEPDVSTEEDGGEDENDNEDAGNMCEGCGEHYEDCICDPCPNCGELEHTCICHDEDDEDRSEPKQETDYITEPEDVVPVSNCAPPQSDTENVKECVDCGNLTTHCNCKIAVQVTEDTDLRIRVCKVLMDQTGLEMSQIVDGDTLTGDLGFDSLDCIEAMLALESEFEIEIRDQQAEACKTVKDVVDLIAKLTQKTPPTPQQQRTELFSRGYTDGRKDGTRRRARKFFDGDEMVQTADMYEFVLGYNQGYRDARWDYGTKQ